MNTVTQEEYWPMILADPTQHGQIETDSAEFNTRANILYEVLKDTLLPCDKPIYVQQWEINLGITPAEGATLTERKAAALYSMSCDLPVTAGLVEKALEKIVDPENIRVEVTPDKLTVSVGLETTQAQIADIKALLDRVLPRNLVTEFDPFPCDFTRVEYLEKNQMAQYIDSGVLNMYTYELDYRVKVSNATQYVIGYQVKNTNLTYGCHGDSFIAITEMTGGMYSRRTSISSSERHTLKHGQNMGGICYVDGLRQTTSAYGARGAGGATEEDISLYLFGCHNANGLYHSSTFPIIYACKTWDKDENLLGDFVPALDPTGAPCMFDLVTRKAFYNSGPGDFLYPTESTTYSLRRVLPDWGKLTPTGLRRLYSAPAGYDGELIDYALENGFKPIIEPDMPEEGYWAPEWRETEDEIILDWVETEPPVEETLTETE